jgi:hypothetical protein
MDVLAHDAAPLLVRLGGHRISGLPSDRGRTMVAWCSQRPRETQALRATAQRQDAEPTPAHGSRWAVHGIFWALLALGGTVGLLLWGQWGLLIALETIRAYCF